MPPPLQAKQRVLVRFFSSNAASALKSSMMLWSSDLESIAAAAAAYGPQCISIALPNLERTRKGRPSPSDCFNFSLKDPIPSLQLYQCFPSSVNLPMHVDVWLIILDEEAKEVTNYLRESGSGKRNSGSSIFSASSLSRLSMRRKKSTDQRTPSGSSMTLAMGSGDLTRAKSEVIFEQRRTRSNSMGGIDTLATLPVPPDTITPGNSITPGSGSSHNASLSSLEGVGKPLQRRMTVTGTMRQRRASQSTLNSESGMSLSVESRDCFSRAQWNTHSFSGRRTPAAASPAPPTESSKINTYTEIVDPAETKQHNLYQEIVANSSPALVDVDRSRKPQVVATGSALNPNYQQGGKSSTNSSRQSSTKKSSSGVQTPVLGDTVSDTQSPPSDSTSSDSPRDLKRKTTVVQRLKNWLMA